MALSVTPPVKLCVFARSMVMSPVALKVEEAPTEISAVAASVMSVPAVTVSAPVAAIWSRSMLLASVSSIDVPLADAAPVKSLFARRRPMVPDAVASMSRARMYPPVWLMMPSSAVRSRSENTPALTELSRLTTPVTSISPP